MNQQPPSTDPALLTWKKSDGLPSRCMNNNKNSNNQNKSRSSSQSGQPYAIKKKSKLGDFNGNKNEVSKECRSLSSYVTDACAEVRPVLR